MISIDGSDISGITIDGSNVTQVTVDGIVVWQSITTITFSNSGPDGDLFNFQYTFTRTQEPGMNADFSNVFYYYDENLTQEIPQYRDPDTPSVVTLKLDLPEGDTTIYEYVDESGGTSNSDEDAVFVRIEPLSAAPGEVQWSQTPTSGSKSYFIDDDLGTYLDYNTDSDTWGRRYFSTPVYIHKITGAGGSSSSAADFEIALYDGSSWTQVDHWTGGSYRHTYRPYSYVRSGGWSYARIRHWDGGWHDLGPIKIIGKKPTANTVTHSYN